MTGLHRTTLTTADKIELTTKAILNQAHRTVTALSQEYALSRSTVYSARGAVTSVLETHFEKPVVEDDVVVIRVDRAQLERAVVGARMEAPCSIRDIEALLPIFYPGLTRSYGTIQGILARTKEKAAQLNRQADLSAIHNGALDEMFSQDDPILAGVDLDVGYLFSLALRDSRGGEDWAEVLQQAASQQLKLSVVVKDAAAGIAASVNAVFPDAEQRDDCFHVWLAISRLHQVLENKAYAAISAEAETQRRYQKCIARGGDERASLAQVLVRQHQTCEQVIEHVDCCGRAMELVCEAFSFIDLATGSLYSAQDATEKLELAAGLLGCWVPSTTTEPPRSPTIWIIGPPV